MPINRTSVREALKNFDFGALLIEELGWDRHRTQPLSVAVDGKHYVVKAIAEKRGMVVFESEPGPDGTLPDYATRRKIEKQIRKAAHEHLIIYADGARKTQIWQWVRREPGRPDACREHRFTVGQPGDALVQKLEAISFSLDEEEELGIATVTGRAREAFDVERVTKRFYDRFKTEHAAFLKFIRGMQSQGDREWYASVMLNRLMFVYFIQKKGLLDGDTNYLRVRLRLMQERKGRNKFHSFYRHFLLRLFHEGLGHDKRTLELDTLLGRVPYLNGGLFDVHLLEQEYQNIEIPDVAFEKIFDFFDAYQWHLDERPLRNDNEINPDVLGFIFEKYINQKEMGAYYSKEDITEYIAKSSVIPYLFHQAKKECAIAFRPNSLVWRLPREDPDRYIYEAVRSGCDLPLPPDLSGAVLDGTRPSRWHEAAEIGYALPGTEETWRDYVARRRHYTECRSLVAEGAVATIEDLVTQNLDVRQFAQDVIESAEGPELVRAIFHTIQGTSILDPACGSGAFLFAALNVLETLYEACLERMRGFLEERSSLATGQDGEKFSDFRRILEDAARHPNLRYFVLKSIIIDNLYGVDIMEEAVEICKLRLFLKLVAQVETVEELEPLPDIDFNIRAGNSLVGFATYGEVREAITSRMDFDDAMSRIDDRAEQADLAFKGFRAFQTKRETLSETLSEAKADLRAKLKELADELDCYLAQEYGVDISNTRKLESWRADHQPFHWFVEFYGIVKTGGFSAIIGNPPYVEVPKALNRGLLRDAFKSALERWSRDEDLCTFFVERSLALGDPDIGTFGMILPLSVAFSTKRPFISLREVIQKEAGRWWWSHYDRIPSALFGGDVRTRNTILLMSRSSKRSEHATTAILRWPSDYRPHLFPNIKYARLDVELAAGVPKVGSQIQADTLAKLIGLKTPLARDLVAPIPFSTLAAAAPRFPQPAVYVGGTAYNWFPAWRDIPKTTDMQGQASLPARTAGFRFRDEKSANAVFALLCSSLGYWWWAVASDGFNLKKWLLGRFPVSTTTLAPAGLEELAELGRILRTELKKHYVYKDNKGRIGNFFLPACQKEIEAIDDALVKHCPALSPRFFEDVRAFNQTFSRAEDAADVEGAYDD
jgi:Eco57I restriction-modification methylase